MEVTSKKAPDAKERILIATLKVIKEKGMRGVLHRAVAAEAGVSLGSTTYHFKDIEDLISSTFIYWHENQDVGENPHFISISEDVENLIKTKTDKQVFIEKLLEDCDKFFKDQVFEKEDERLIELAFHNEALRNEKLSALLLSSWKREIIRLVNLFQILGTDEPESDAEVTFALIMQLEKRAMLIKDTEEQRVACERMGQVLKRHILMLVKDVI